MNIALISDQYWPSMSGVSVSIDTFSKELTAMGHRIFLFVPEYPGSAYYDSRYDGTEIFRFRSARIPFNEENRLVYRRERKKINRILNSVKPDVIHIQTEFSLCRIATKYARKMKIPLVMSAHANWEELITLYTPVPNLNLARLFCRAFIRKRYNRADMIIVPSSLMEVLFNLYFISKPIRIIPTGILTEDFENRNNNDWKNHIYKDYPKLINKKILFYAGRLGMEKNIKFLMDVLKLLLPSDKDLILMIAGNGPAYNELFEYSKKLGINDHILFTGFIDRKRIRDFYSISDVFVFASKVESQGLAIIESMTCGTPVVAIGKMGIREVMGGDNGGFMVDDDIYAFAEKTSLLLNDPEIHQIKSKEAIAHVRKWTIDKYADKLVRLYESLIAEKRAEVASAPNSKL